MTSFKGHSARFIDKFKIENLNLWKFKLDIALVFMDLWCILIEYKETVPSNVDPKMKKKYE